MSNKMSGRASAATCIQAGDRLAPLDLVTIHGQHVRVPDGHRVVHLQFRRFAGCPVCKLHLRSIAQRHEELVKASIREVAVFHSSIETMLRHDEDLPFAVVADPEKRLYRHFGVEASLRSVLDPRAWGAIARGLATFRVGREAGEPALGLPADFLIGPDGKVRACKYGTHADDHWSVDEILERSWAMTWLEADRPALHATDTVAAEGGRIDG